MNSNPKKNIYSIFIAITFLVIATASTSVSKLHCGAFSLKPDGEYVTDKNYVELNDGTRIFGDKIKFSFSAYVKVDDVKYKLSDTKGYSENGIYYYRYKKTFYQRIVHGKLNVYTSHEFITTTSTDHAGFSHTTGRTHCYFYVQQGEDGPLKQIGGQSQIKEYVKDCPKAYEMIDKSNKEIRQALREDPSYLNKIFITYNDGCK
ncbi:MAG: hypothetical protein JSU05_11920 [Bacteroidetes bacterium]|nr:hypothetical protein [Bacteroidota bacterium]